MANCAVQRRDLARGPRREALIWIKCVRPIEAVCGGVEAAQRHSAHGRGGESMMAAEPQMLADTVPVYASPVPAIRKIELDRPWQWLVRGSQDLRRSPTVGLTYGVLAAVIGYALT